MDTSTATEERVGRYTPPDRATHRSLATAELEQIELEGLTISKVNRRLLPILFGLYMCCYLDRQNIAFAALRMNADLHFTATIYSIGAAVFFIGYAVFEVPSNLVLARVGARRWIARIAITWGLIASSMMFVRSPSSFYALRLLLGIAEAGFFPGVVFYLSQWYPATYRARAVSRFMMAVPVISIISGPLGGALLSLNGALGLAGWQWLFLVEGLPTIALGALVLVVLPDAPGQSSWLNAAERTWLTDRLANDAAQSHRPDATVWQALSDRRVWTLSALLGLTLFAGYGYTFWAPAIVRETLHTPDIATGLVLGTVSAVTAIVMIVVGKSSDRTGERPLHVAGSALVFAIGFLGAGIAPLSLVGLAFLFLVPPGVMSLYGPFMALVCGLLRGRGAAAGIAFVSSVANLGSFLSPIVAGWIRDRTGGFAEAHLAYAVAGFSAALIAVALKYRTPSTAPLRAQ